VSTAVAPLVVSRRARNRAMAAYLAVLLVWSWFVGIPTDPGGVVLWIWLGTIAWDVDAEPRSHLAFWRDWWLPVLLLAVYWLVRGLADQVGIAPHYSMPIRVDEWLASLVGSGSVPTVALQHAWCGDPCVKSLPPRWFDTLLTSVYASHFLVALTMAGVLWVRNRDEWVRWLRRYLSLLFSGLATYVVYPMAPPWMAARDGYLPEVHRITGRGWSSLEFHGVGLHRQTMVMWGMGNKVAAMPSLHAGIAFLVAFWFVSRLHSPYRWLLLLYPLVMSLSLVYFAEHYAVDVLVGGVLAAVVMVAVGRWERRRAA
jgi:membrane-associated phospholipid phosphatase